MYILYVPCNELMFAIHHDSFLTKNMLLLLCIHNMLLFQAFQSISFSFFFSNLRNKKNLEVKLRPLMVEQKIFR